MPSVFTIDGVAPCRYHLRMGPGRIQGCYTSKERAERAARVMGGRVVRARPPGVPFSGLRGTKIEHRKRIGRLYPRYADKLVDAAQNAHAGNCRRAIRFFEDAAMLKGMIAAHAGDSEMTSRQMGRLVRRVDEDFRAMRRVVTGRCAIR